MRQFIEEKLLELRHKLHNVLVVVNKDERIFLVYEKGYNTSTEHMSKIQRHVCYVV